MSYRSRAQSQPRGSAKSTRGSINAFFSDGRRPCDELTKMVPSQDRGKNAATAAQASLQPAVCPINSPRLVSDIAAPASSGSSASHDQGSDISELQGDRDLKQHIWSLPTREDLEKFACRVEKAFKQDIEQLQNDTTQLGIRMKPLEQRIEDSLPALSKLRDTCSP